MLITALCTNLFGFRTKAANRINRIRWNIDCESISVETALHAIMGNTQGIDVLDEIIFPKEAYVDDYNAKTSIIMICMMKSPIDMKSTSACRKSRHLSLSLRCQMQTLLRNIEHQLTNYGICISHNLSEHYQVIGFHVCLKDYMELSILPIRELTLRQLLDLPVFI